ncbi:MoaD/ThiS family protein [Kineococcus siccus]|uniref:MoaD/ThiS family protein n=1 Tax=Kineococcus siccus TaxID=2696567 RepID=UPI0030B7FDFD
MAHLLTVRYFAGAAAAAGCEERKVEVSPTAPLGELLDRLAAEGGEALTRVLSASSFLLDATAARRETVLGEAGTLDVLPPFAGG